MNNYNIPVPGNPQNKRVTILMRALIEGDVSGLGQGVLQPSIPVDPDTSAEQEAQQSNSQVINNTPSAQNPRPPIQAGEDLQIEQQIIGQEDPIKKFIDKLVDTKNKLYDANSKSEIQRTVSNT